MRALSIVVLVTMAVAAGIPSRARASTEGEQRRALQAACGDSRAAACRELGVRALAGEGEPRNDRLGAAYLLWACDLGDRTGCARLAALYAAGTGVRLDLSRAASLARAAGADPVRVRTHGEISGSRPPLGPMSGPDLERQLELVEAFVPESVRESLALDRERIASEGLAPPEDRILIETLVRERIPFVATCVARAPSGTTGVGWASFVIAEGGRASDVRVDASGAGPSAVDCLRERIAAWEFPLPRRSSGGLVWFEVVGTPPRERPAAAPPVAGRRPPSGRAPALEDAGCVRDALWVRAGEPTGSQEPVVLRFRVGADGEVSEVHFLTPAPLALARALGRAVRECAWAPALDARGRTVSAWTVLPVRVGGG